MEKNFAGVMGIARAIDCEIGSKTNAGDVYLRVVISIPRNRTALSIDHVVVMIPATNNRIRGLDTMKPGDAVMASGCIQKKTNGRGGHTEVYILADYASTVKYPYYQNGIVLSGTVANDPVMRITPLTGKRITEFMLRIADRVKGGNIRIPCICWEEDAVRMRHCKRGTEVEITGRLQSREYTKLTGEKRELHITYEVSAREVRIIRQ